VRAHYARQLGLGEAEIEAYLEDQWSRQRELAPRHRRSIAQLGHARGLPIASHDDQTPDHVADAKHHGIGLAEFPTTLAAARAARDHGLDVLMGAPNLIRGGSHSGNVAAAELARADLLDVLASDYVPASLLAGAFRLAGADIGWDLPRAIAAVSATPAAVAGLEDRGVLEPGRRADLLRVAVVDDRPVVREVWRAGRRVC
jgi:alpha-D-ribose 1-methylphosphonate 5-triphosphate diphosphatase